MAVYKLFPSQDTSLYSQYPTMNTGIDPINQVSNLNFALSTSPTVARTLIRFETSEIQDLINNRVSGSWEAYIKSFIATGQGVYKETTLEIFPVTESWYNGTGTYLDQPLTTDGANWGSPTVGGGPAWSTGDGTTTTSSYSTQYSPVVVVGIYPLQPHLV